MDKSMISAAPQEFREVIKPRDKEWRNEKGWLTDTCLDGQDTFVRLLDMLEIER